MTCRYSMASTRVCSRARDLSKPAAVCGHSRELKVWQFHFLWSARPHPRSSFPSLDLTWGHFICPGRGQESIFRRSIHQPVIGTALDVMRDGVRTRVRLGLLRAIMELSILDAYKELEAPRFATFGRWGDEAEERPRTTKVSRNMPYRFIEQIWITAVASAFPFTNSSGAHTHFRVRTVLPMLSVCSSSKHFFAIYLCLLNFIISSGR